MKRFFAVRAPFIVPNDILEIYELQPSLPVEILHPNSFPILILNTRRASIVIIILSATRLRNFLF